MISVSKLGVIGVIALTLSACAQVPKEMQYRVGPADAAAKMWPGEPEIPRYRYFGELTGEGNFRPVDGVQEGAGRKFLRWLVGLGAGRNNPIVLQRPQAGVVDASGRILVTDMSRAAVFVFDPVNAELDVWDLAEWTSPFVAPVGIALGANNEVLVADAEQGQVYRLSGDGKPISSFGADVLTRPTGLARDPVRGRVFVADTRAHDVKVFDDAGNLLDRIGKPGEGPGEFNAPTHLAIANGKLYVTDTFNARVQIFSLDGDAKMEVGSRGLYVGNFTRPKGVAVDSDENVYVVESYYDYLLIYDKQGRYLMPLGGTGSGVGNFFLPAGVWTDSQDRVFVADMFNGRVVVLQYLGQ